MDDKIRDYDDYTPMSDAERDQIIRRKTAWFMLAVASLCIGAGGFYLSVFFSLPALIVVAIPPVFAVIGAVFLARMSNKHE